MATVRRYKGESILGFHDEFVVVDIETTGFNPNRDSIIEIGAIKVVNHKVVDTYNVLINIGKSLSTEISNLTGITNKDLAGGVTIDDAMDSFHEFIGDWLLMGYNVNFDVNFLYDNTLTYTDLVLRNDFVDVMKYAKKIHPELDRHRLTDLVDYYGFDTSNNHRASKDCETTLDVFLALKNEIISKNLHHKLR